jgi:hypothetical protein
MPKEDTKMSYNKSNIKICAICYFNICIHDIKKNEFKSMCEFKKIWYNIPVIIFQSVWLEKRGYQDGL